MNDSESFYSLDAEVKKNRKHSQVAASCTRNKIRCRLLIDSRLKKTRKFGFLYLCGPREAVFAFVSFIPVTLNSSGLCNKFIKSLSRNQTCIEMLDGIKIEDQLRSGPASLGLMLGKFNSIKNIQCE